MIGSDNSCGEAADELLPATLIRIAC